MGNAPRAPSSAGWKTRRSLPRRCGRIAASTAARPSPTATCPSCPQACMSPGWTDPNPSRRGRCSAAPDSATSLQSISKRKASDGPGPQSRSAQNPVYPSPMRATSSGSAPSARARSRAAARATGDGTPIRFSGTHAALPIRIVNPHSRSRAIASAAVRNSVQPASGKRCRSRRQPVSRADAEARASSRKDREPPAIRTVLLAKFRRRKAPAGQKGQDTDGV